jgi:hypothetical protein
MISDAITSRATSAFPISVGTSLALESTLLTRSSESIDPERVPPQQIDLSDYDELWFNVSTLYRNLYGSINKENINKLNANVLTYALNEEIEFIDSLVSSQTNGKTKVIFYVCEYKNFDKKYPNAYLRTINTENQEKYKKLHDNVISMLLNQLGKKDIIRIFDSELKTINYRKCLIVTHIAHDLLSHSNFKELNLLESHTGVLKKKHQWSSKYVEGKNLPMMPFNKGLLQIFGDSEHFRPFPLAVRKKVLELAEKDKWTPLTTKDKIVYSLNKLMDQFTLTVLLKLF